MSAFPTPAAPQQGARRTRKTGCRLHLHLPMLVGVIASGAAFGQLGAAPRDGAQALEHARATRLVADAPSLRLDAMPAHLGRDSSSDSTPDAAADADPDRAADNASLAMVAVPAMDPAWLQLHRAPPQPAAVAAEEPAQTSAADRLRNDPLQTAPVPQPRPQPSTAAKLPSDQRAVARYIAKSYRVAYESVSHFVQHAYQAAREFRLDPHLILAVMAVESSFDPQAENASGAQGLMQVLTRVHTSKFEPYGGVEAAWDPVANIRVGARILSEYVGRYGDVAAGLKAYVGAALLASDGGYGSKVLKRQAEFDAVLRPSEPAILEAATKPASSGDGGGSIGVTGTAATAGTAATVGTSGSPGSSLGL